LTSASSSTTKHLLIKVYASSASGNDRELISRVCLNDFVTTCPPGYARQEMLYMNDADNTVFTVDIRID
jgi:hypothetical protein